ncbi:unnamed protein product [Rotaria magnacalcarata]|uniref:Uncharacterized protein n=1 Tax=Rotaria magnacalcarata TaxID=392030 RepID=A0A820FXR1_9BILA|nr:unnamed protein product [Rotaria magnacalcarata]
MMLKKPFVNTNRVPDDMFSYQDGQFYDFIKKLIGDKQANLLAFQEISNADIYLHCCNVLNILKLDSSALIPYKESLCLKLDDNSYTVLPDKAEAAKLYPLALQLISMVPTIAQQYSIHFQHVPIPCVHNQVLLQWMFPHPLILTLGALLS